MTTEDAERELRSEVEKLLREAGEELKWWIDNHGCCRGHEGDILKRIDERLTQK